MQTVSFSLTGSDAGSAVRQVCPDIGVLVVGLLTWRLLVTLNADTHTQVTHTQTKEAGVTLLGRLLLFLNEIFCLLVCNSVSYLLTLTSLSDKRHKQ